MIFSYLKNKTVHKEEWTGSFDESVDAAVVGLGTAGAIALISAGRQGLSTIGIEQNSFMGGVGTGGAIHMYYYGTLGGIQMEIDEKVQVFNKVYSPSGVQGFHPDVKKKVLEEEALKNNSQIYYRSSVIGIILDENKVVGVQVITPEGIKTIQTKFVIDASGDAQACVLAGGDFTIGREIDGMPQPYSAPRGMHNGKVSSANFDAGYVNPTDADEISASICNAQTLHLKDKFVEDSKLLYVSPHLGLREGRFIVGEDTLNFEQMLLEEKPAEWTMQTYAHHDNHSRDWAFESDLAQEWVTICSFWSRMTMAYVKPGIVIPKGIDGLLVAGRCVSIDHDTAQTFRMQRDMQKLGEITGVMAGLSIKANCMAKDLPYNELSKELQTNGCKPLPEKEKKWGDWITDVSAIKEGLASTYPGIAIWSIKRKGSSFIPNLVEWLDEDGDDLFLKHVAFALTIVGDDSGKDILIGMVEENDQGLATSKEIRTHFPQKRVHGALFGLGVLHVKESVETIKKFLVNHLNDFQDVSQSVMALLKIAEKHEDVRESILDCILGEIDTQSFKFILEMQVSNGDQKSTCQDMKTFLIKHVKSKQKEWLSAVCV
ncbi:MAG: hypothetical protein COA79_10490 [Planctomycetota bacterium]|nr:MAG: hypothetical protein COA79_10490 [Planctomycetota bacterium]